MIKRLFLLAWPLFVAQLAVAAMAATDTLVAGRAGTHEQAVVAVGSNLLLLAIMFIYGILLVVPPLAAELRTTAWSQLSVLLQQALVVGILASVAGCLLLAGLWLLLPKLVMPELVKGVSHYLWFGMPGLILASVYFALRLFWEGMHHTVWTAGVSILLFMFNIPLDWLFVIEMEMGGAGCALATSLSFLLAVSLALFLYRKHPRLSVIIEHSWPLRIHGPLLGKILQLGLPASLALLSEVSLFMLLALLIAPFGVVALAGHQIAINITSLLYVLPFSLSLALAIETGHLKGRGMPAMQRRLIRRGMLLSLVLGVGLSLFTLALHSVFPHFFAQDSAVVKMAGVLLLYAAAYQIMDAIQMGGAGILRGMGDTRWILGTTLFSYWGLGIPIGVWLAWREGWEAEGYWMGIVIALTLAAMLLSVRIIYHYRRLT